MTSSQGGLTDFQLLRHRNEAYERLFDHEKLIEPNGDHWLTKRYELHLQTTLHLNSKNFRSFLKAMKLSGVCVKQQSLRPLLTAVDVSVLERRREARKQLLGGTRKLKKLFVQKKWSLRPALQISHYLNFVRSTLKHVRRQPQKLNCLRKGKNKRAWKKFLKRLDHGSSTGAILAFRGSIVTILEIGGRFYLSEGRFQTCQYC